MDIVLIVATSDNGAIGINNTLPWHMPADLKHFKKLTMGHPIVMGRKTYEAIGRPLPGRQNIVLSRDVNFNPIGCTIVKSKEEAIQAADNASVLMIIGGATVYHEFLNAADKIYLTKIHTIVEGDAFFPTIDDNGWVKTREEHLEADEHNPYSYSFIEYERR